MMWGPLPLAGESGANDPSVLPVRHTLECPRQATLVVSALQRHAVGAIGNRGTPAAGRRSGLGSWTANGAAATPGLPMDRGASGSTTSTPSASPSAGPDPAVSGDTPLGSGGPGRSRRRAGPGSAAGAAGRAGAYGVLHCRGGVGGGGCGASGAVSAAGHQPPHAAELDGGGCGSAAECVGQPGRDRGGDELRGGVDAMVYRP